MSLSFHFLVCLVILSTALSFQASKSRKNLGLTMSSISELEAKLRSMEPTEERENYELQQRGYGTTNHKTDIRLFDKPEGYEPEVILYRDQAAWCPYCEKVWLQLEEKKIPYKMIKIPLRCYGSKPSYFQREINPSGSLPVATIKGVTITESNDIMTTLEKQFPDHHPLIPREQEQDKQQRMQQLLRLERKAFSAWFNWITSRPAGGGGLGGFLNKVGGSDRGAQQMDAVLREVDGQLKESQRLYGGPFFLGDFSLVDCMYAPFLERMAASLPYYRAFESRSPEYPHLLQWYTAMDEREAYRGVKSDYYTHVHDLPPQVSLRFKALLLYTVDILCNGAVY